MQFKNEKHKEEFTQARKEITNQKQYYGFSCIYKASRRKRNRSSCV